MPDNMQPAPSIEEIKKRLGSASEDERAAAVEALAREVAARVGLSWDDILAHHKRTHRSPPDTDWQELPPLDGYPGWQRRYKGRLLIARQRGRAISGRGVILPCAWHMTIDGELVSNSQAHIFFDDEEQAMRAAEKLVDEMMLENA